MAAEQLRRDNDAGEEPQVHVDGGGVPKMAETLGSGVGGDSPGRTEEEGTREIGEEREGAEKRKGVGESKGGFSNEEISGYRQQAQQGSIDAIRAAEERYNQAKATATSALQNVKDDVFEKGAQAKNIVLGKGTEGPHKTEESLGHVKDTVGEGAQKEAQYVAEKGTQAKDILAEGSQKTTQYAAEKGTQAKDTLAEKGRLVKDTALEKGQEGKEYAAQKAEEAKEGTTSVAGKGKEMVVNAAVEVKDRTAVAGWTVAHYAADLTVEGTKKAADVAKGVAGYAGEKTVAAKDVMAQAGQKAVEYTGEKVGVGKDKVVETEESIRDYAARKKEEAKSELEGAKKMGHQMEGMGEPGTGEERSISDEVVQKSKEAVGKFFKGEEQQQSNGREGVNGGGVPQAIVETIAEIAQTTKDLVIGKNGDGEQGEKQGEHQK